MLKSKKYFMDKVELSRVRDLENICESTAKTPRSPRNRQGQDHQRKWRPTLWDHLGGLGVLAWHWL